MLIDFVVELIDFVVELILVCCRVNSGLFHLHIFPAKVMAISSKHIVSSLLLPLSRYYSSVVLKRRRKLASYPSSEKAFPFPFHIPTLSF